MLTLRTNRMLPEAASLTGELDRVFDALWTAPFGMASQNQCAAFPALNVFEGEDAFHVEAELAGFRMQDLEISLTGDELTISGSRETEKVENGTFHRQERLSGKFSRRLRLGTPIDSDKVSAAMENGVLTVTLPKAAAARARKISVTSK